MQAKEIANSLARDTEAVCRHLLPAGKRAGHEWEVGSISGDAGKSLKVHLSGDKAGVWSDFASGAAGDLLDLWAAVHGLSISEAMIEARSFLGVSTPSFAQKPRKSFQRPKSPAQIPAGNAVLRYLHEERGLSLAAIDAYGVSSSPTDDAVMFPFMRGGELVMAKRLMLARPDGKKDIRPTQSGCEPCLFGWQAIPDDARTVVIVEGELDAMSCWQMGHPALSVPFGGGGGQKQAWIENDFDYLERFDEIILCFDRDEQGLAAVREIAERLGPHRCKVASIPPPHKDANDLLRTGGELSPLIKRAAPLDPAELKSAADFVDDVIADIYPSDEREPGFYPAWNKLRGKLHHRWAELTIVSGTNGHGKSQFVGQMVLGVIQQEERVCIASMELQPKRLLSRLTRQVAGLREGEPTEQFIRSIHDWYRDQLWIFDVVGTAKSDRLLEVFLYARRRYGIRVFVIDSLLKCGVDESDYDGQKRFVERLADFKNQHDCHVFLVTHSRKGESEEQPTGKHDVRGAAAITDLADTVLTIWRNKRKENLINRAQAADEVVDQSTLDKPDAVLYCHKQRNAGWEKQAAFWWHQNSLQFLEHQSQRPTAFVKYSSTTIAAA